MSTPEEVERERASLIELSETVRKTGEQVKGLRETQLPWFQEVLDKIRETNTPPAFELPDGVGLDKDAARDPQKVEKALEAFISRMTSELAESQRLIEATWLGLQESIIALEETGQVPPPSPPGTKLLPDLPPQPGPDDEM